MEPTDAPTPELPEPEAPEPGRGASWWLRLAVVPVVAVLAAVLLLGRDGPAGKPVTTKHGSTTQGRSFELGLDADGEVAHFDTMVVAACPNGHRLALPWDPTDGDPVLFKRDGDRLRVRERGETYALGLDARQTKGGGLHGTLSVVIHVKPKTRPAYDCTGSDVRFFAGA